MSNVGFIGAAEVTGIIGLGEAQVWRLTRAGKLPQPVKIGRRTLWRRDEVVAWVEQQTVAYRAGKTSQKRARLPSHPGRRKRSAASDITSPDVLIASDAEGIFPDTHQSQRTAEKQS